MSIIKIIFAALFLIFLNFFSYASLNPINDWSFYFKRGVKQYDAHMMNEAIDSFKLSLSMNPLNYPALNYLGRLHLKKNYRENALEYFLKSVYIKKDQPEINFNIGHIYRYFLDYEKALKYLAYSSSDGEYGTRSRILMSQILFRTGKQKEAQVIIKQIREEKLPHSIPLLKKSGSRELTAYPLQRLKLLRSAIEINPAHEKLYIESATIYRSIGKYADAAVILEEGKSVDPEQKEFYIHLGNLYFNRTFPDIKRVRALELSIKNFREALRLDPSDDETRTDLVRVLRFCGKNEEADREKKKITENQKK